ncbi:acid protease [Westerdykella ornata]|uniref:Acid protease n=1 Tax=Westerdykella ornata TaxID=318751 RepID=A0A6A6JCY2_WESOR|nr:acid protease [Westerdykella ornata]KAF2274480.1 acid protease [Westerdykella ornata]
MYLFASFLQIGVVHAFVLPPRTPDERQQNVLAEAGSDTGRFSIPVKSLDGLFHTIDVAVGTPPQHFNVSLDLMNGGMLLPSINCDSSCTTKGTRRLYDRSASSTSESKCTVTWQDFFGHNYFGDLVRDTVHFSGLKFPGVAFLEYDWRSDGSPFKFPDDGFDGMIGLAPPWDSLNSYRRTEYSSFLSKLYSEPLLDEMIFSLALPRGLEDEGEIMFGGTNSGLYSGEFSTVDVVELDSGLSSSNVPWVLPSSNITLHTPTPYPVPLPVDSVAVLTSNPFIVFPKSLQVEDFYNVIGAEWINELWASVPCDRRPHLPDLTFEIGGHELTISGFDYTFEHRLDGPDKKPACLLWIMDHDDTGLPDNAIALGPHFLKRFYTVFDFGERRVRFAERK